MGLQRVRHYWATEKQQRHVEIVKFYALQPQEAHQAPWSMEMSRQDYWSGLPFLSSGDLPDSEIKPMSLTSPALAGTFFVVVQSLSQKIKICLCNPKDCNTPGFPVLHYLPEFAKTHVHWVDDAIQPTHPLLPTSPPALNLSQNQGLFQWDSSSHQVAKVLEL